MSANQSLAPAKWSNLWDVLRHVSGSKKVWFGLVAYMVLVKLVLDAFFPNALADPAQGAFFQWVPLALVSLVGFAGVLLTERTGFPDAWETLRADRRRVVYAIGAGLAFGVIAVVFDQLTHFTSYILARHGLVQQFTGYVPMFFAFSVGAVIVEVFYRLVVIPLPLWLVSNLLLHGKRQNLIFWTLAIPLSALELLFSAADVLTLPGPLLIVDAVLLYVLNLTQVVFMRRYGYFASFLVRLVFYLVWHVTYVH
jgi:hypothetical protein